RTQGDHNETRAPKDVDDAGVLDREAHKPQHEHHRHRRAKSRYQNRRRVIQFSSPSLSAPRPKRPIVSTRRAHTSTKDRTRLGSSLIFSRWNSSESALRSAEVRRRVKREQPQIIFARPKDGDPGIVDYDKYAQKLLVSKPEGRRGKDRHRSCGGEIGRASCRERGEIGRGIRGG